METYIKGAVEAIYFQNDVNYYKVALVSIDETNSDYVDNTIVVTGTMGQVHEGTEYTFFGQLVEHARYGLQMQISRYEQTSLSSEKGLISYLSSDKFPGIGNVLATRIVDTLGSNAIEKIIENHIDLTTITGLSADKQQMLIDIVTKDQSENKAILDLIKLGFSDKEAYKIFNYYKQSAVQTMTDNPYLAIETIEGIGFAKVDYLCEQLDIDSNDSRRFRGALFYALQELSYKQGHTHFEVNTVVNVAIKVLENSRKMIINETALVHVLGELIQTGVIIEDNRQLSLPSLYYAEEGIAKKVNYLLQQEEIILSESQINKVIQTVEKQLSIQYATQQKAAIKQAVKSPISIVTGGPGTGKTTVLKGIVHVFSQLHQIDLHTINDYNTPIVLAAPTGRAAKRMKELIGLPSSTLHRLLGIGITGNDVLTNDMITNELATKLLIIDEMSMVDTWLMNWVLKSVHKHTQIVLVGDVHQLPSVGPGQVLYDLLTSQTVPAIQLDTVFRQDEQSSIISLAHSIKNGYLPEDFAVNQVDRSFIRATTNQVASIIKQIVERAINKGYSINDVQILAPMYKGNAGITLLNNTIQSLVNPPLHNKREVKVFDKVFRVNDKVLQLVNTPEKNVFNGDVGQITAILMPQESENNVEEIIVTFDDADVRYKKNEYNQLTLAYCCSVHKAQGSEFPVVIIPMVQQYYRMLRRDLLYTALTRSKQSVVFCGELSAFETATKTDSLKRHTMLVEKLHLFCKGVEYDKIVNKKQESSKVLEVVTPFEQLLGNGKKQNTLVKQQTTFILTEQNINDIDGMIGMDNITPMSFEIDIRR